MATAPSAVDDLLRETESQFVVPVRYSRKSMLGRCAPLMLTTALAVTAVFGSMLLCEVTRRAD